MQTPSARNIELLRALISDVIPVCTICGLTSRGHFFQHVAVTAITKTNTERAKALLSAVGAEDWDAMRRFQDGKGSAANFDVVGLKCVDGRCSLAVLYCPHAFEEPYRLVLQNLVADCTPLADSFVGQI
jgi:hypothetical protein